MSISPVQWLLLAVSSFGIGLSKAGIAGFGIVAVALFANALPAKQSIGLALPVLIVGDVCAVSLYRKRAVWHHLIGLLPWAVAGLLIGYYALGHVNDRQVGPLIGVILIALTALQFVRRQHARRRAASASGMASERADQGVSQSGLTMALMGLLAGSTTMIANAAGPVMVLYLLAARLPKVEFIGTGAWFFLIVNLLKVPLSAHLGLVNVRSLPVDALLAPLVLLGAFAGTHLLHRIEQTVFENVAMALTLLAAMKLLIPAG